MRKAALAARNRTDHFISKRKNIKYYQLNSPRRQKQGRAGKKFLALGAGALIVLVKALFLAGRFLSVLFSYGIFKPFYYGLRFVFYNAVVKLYGWHRKLIKKLGWSERRPYPFSFFFHQRSVHFFLVFISASLIFINLTGGVKAVNLTDKAHSTILYDLIRRDFPGHVDDEQYVVETFDQEAVITPLQQAYLENLSVLRAQPRASFNTDEEEFAPEETPTIQEGSAIVKPDIVSTRITKRARTGPVIHTVIPGDTVSTIAEEYEISVSTILWENNLSAYSIIRPGDQLTILPQNGLNHKVASGETLGSLAKKYSIAEEEIRTANKLSENAILAIGEKLFIPGGRKIQPVAPPRVAYTGISAIRDIVAAPSAKPVPGNKMNWPTVGSRITQYFTWRHAAIDIADKTGTPIYAADAGTIEFIGWGTGYGNQIVIDHGGGKKTRYAHLSAFSVKSGDKVSKGQTIGAMGSTGWSTGPHLHFEVIIDGRKQNPLNYLR